MYQILFFCLLIHVSIFTDFHSQCLTCKSVLVDAILFCHCLTCFHYDIGALKHVKFIVVIYTMIVVLDGY
jgi:hypothetical protein